MVVFWSADLTKPLLAAAVYIVLGSLLLFFYLKVLPRLEGHWKVRMYLEGAVMVIIITDILSLFLTPDLLNHSVLYDIFQSRQIPDGGHITSLLIVMFVVVITGVMWDDWLKALMYGGLTVFLHEIVYFLCYYTAYPENLNYTVDFGFICWLLSMWYVGRKVYHFKVWLPGYAAFLGYMAGWLANGFPISATNKFISCANLYCPKVLGATALYGDFHTNAIETFSWMLIVSVMLVSIRLNKQVKPVTAGMAKGLFSRNSKSLNFSQIWKRRLSTVVVLFLLLAAFLVLAPATHALSPVTQQNCFNSGASVGSGTCTFPGNTHSGSLLVVLFGDSSGGTSKLSSVADTAGSIWSTPVCSTNTGTASCSAYAYAAGAETVLTLTFSAASGNQQWWGFEIQNDAGAALCTATGFNTGGTLQTSTTCGIGASIVFAGGLGACNQGGGCGSAATGFGNANNQHWTASNLELCGTGAGVTGIGGTNGCGSVVAPTNFPQGAVTPAWTDEGIVVGAAAGTGFCYNGQNLCYEQQPTGSFANNASSTMKDRVTGATWPTILLSNPFTEVVQVLCQGLSVGGGSPVGFYPTSVSSADFGYLSNGGNPQLAVMQYMLPNTINNGIPNADADSLSLSVWFILQTGGTTKTTDLITVTFAANINTMTGTNNKGCTVVIGFIGGSTGQTYAPYLVGQASTGYWVNDGSVRSSSGFTGTGIPTLAMGDVFTSMVTTTSIAGYASGTGGWIVSNHCDVAGICASGAGGYSAVSTSGNSVQDQLWLDSSWYANGVQAGAGAVSTQPSGGTPVAGGIAQILTLYWTASGQAVTCTSCQSTSGSGTSTGTSGTLDGNQTIFYFGTTIGQDGLIISNITTKIASISAAGATCNSVAAHVCITLGVWYVPNYLSVSPSNPLIQDTPPACFSTISSAVSIASPFYIHFAPSCAVPAGSTYAVGLTADHKGVRLYQASSGAMQNDSADGYFPAKMITYAAVTIPFFLQWTWTMPSITVQVVQTITTVGGGSGATSTVLVYVNQSSPTSVTFWLIPMLFLFTPMALILTFARKLGLQGERTFLLLTVLGLFLGSLLGNMAQVMPYGVTLLLGVILVIIFWRWRG